MTDDITFCGNDCDNTNCIRHSSHSTKTYDSFAYLEGTEYCEKKSKPTSVRLIDAEALKKEIKAYSEYDPMLPNFKVIKIIDNAPTVDAYTEEQVKELVELNKKLSEESLQGEWISVSERLPDDMQRVLIWFEYYRYGDYNCMYQTYGFGYVCDGKWSPFINGETGWQDYRVIAWQPLPEPYKKGGVDNE